MSIGLFARLPQKWPLALSNPNIFMSESGAFRANNIAIIFLRAFFEGETTKGAAVAFRSGPITSLPPKQRVFFPWKVLLPSAFGLRSIGSQL